MINRDYKQRNFTKEQKQIVALLSIGTFLEYFNLALYVHMSELLRPLFLPQTDPHKLLLAITLSTPVILRPLGSLIFGWLGDTRGRKVIIVMMAFLSSISCIIIASLPTYDQIGNIASYLFITCYTIQGMFAANEFIGAEIYLMEMLKPPIQYLAVALMATFAAMGGTVALTIASVISFYGFNWRIAFWLGAGIAIMGIFAKTTLPETPEFTDAKRHIKNIVKNGRKNIKLLSNIVQYEEEIHNNTSITLSLTDANGPIPCHFTFIYKEKTCKSTIFALFLISCSGTLFYYLIYIQCSNILKSSFGYSVGQVIYHDFIVSIIQLFSMLLLTYLSYRIYPLIILKIKIVIFCVSIPLCLYLWEHIITCPFHLLLFRSFITLFTPYRIPATPIFYKYFPIFKRFTYTSFVVTTSTTIMCIVSIFSCIYLIDPFNYQEWLILMIPALAGHMFGLRHFKKLEIEAGNYPQKKKIVP